MRTSACVACLLVLAACAPAQAPVTYSDPQGRFHLSVPRNWSVTPLSEDAVQIGSGAAYVTVLVFPGGDAATAVASLARQAGGQWRGFNEARRGQTRLAGASGIYASYAGTNPKGVEAYLLYTAASAGGRTYVLLMSAPKAEYARYKPSFDQIERSFAFGGGVAAAEEAPVPAGAAATAPAAGPGYLGVMLADVTPESAGELNLPPVNGVAVARVPAGSPGERGGLRTGDLLLAIDGGPVRTAGDVKAALGARPAGATVRLRVNRGGTARDLAVVLGGAPGSAPISAAAGPGPVRVLARNAPMQFVRWADPNENAFSAEVPRGWQVSGGLTRINPLDTRPWLILRSPDGIVVSAGNPQVPPFMPPNQMLDMTGFREGSRYPNQLGGYYIVRRYMPGVNFAEEYARSAMGCSGVNILDRQDRPDLSRDLNRILAQFRSMGANVGLTTGEVSFECTENGRQMAGYNFAGTLFAGSQGGAAIWVVQIRYGFVAPAGRAGLAHAVLEHLIASYRENPQWEAMQQGITKGSSEIIARSNQEVSKIISDTFWNRRRTMDNIMRNDANARRGTTDLVDPGSGETWNVQGGFNHYWRKPGSNEIFGTNTYDPPCFGCQPLQVY